MGTSLRSTFSSLTDIIYVILLLLFLLHYKYDYCSKGYPHPYAALSVTTLVQRLFCNEISCRFLRLWIRVRDASTQSELTGISFKEPGLKTTLSMNLKLNSVDNLSVNRHYVMSTKTSQPMNSIGYT